MKSIVLAGGSGTRLFPLSRKAFPKQFIKLVDKDYSLFQKTLKRNLKLVKNEADIVILTNKDYNFLITHQLEDLGINENNLNILLEPTARNTAPAIALGVKFLLDKLGVGENEVVFVSPSDHFIAPEEKFVKLVKNAEEVAKKGLIVTFGVKPYRPETGYGYIEADFNRKVGPAFKVKKFHEKPDLETALLYIEKGNFYWNAGLFMFQIKTILEEFKKYAPEIYEFITSHSYEDFLKNFPQLPEISIDYAVMEKSSKIAVVPLDIAWSDVGSWDSVYEILEKDNHQNAIRGEVFTLNSKGNLIISEQRLVSTVDVEDLIIVDTKDVLLVTKKGKGQDVKILVKKLKENPKYKPLTEYHKTVYRPWGSYTELENGEGYKIKRLTVKPGGMLSLQMHYHRSEHWIVVRGTAKVILEDDNGNLKEYYVHENESIYVPKTRKHRIINPGKIPLEIIEVQVGNYLEEDDIVRFEDIYNRT